MGKPYQVGLIPCTASKNPAGQTPLSLYKGGPFSLMVRHALQRCDRVVIMSAKYGLLETWDRVRYYDTFIDNLTAAEWQELRVRVQDQIRTRLVGGKCLSYLWRPYWRLFDAANIHGVSVDTPYMGKPSLVLYKILSHEIQAHR